MPDTQTIWNAILGLIVFAITGALSVLRDSLKSMQTEIRDQAVQLHAVQLLVTGDYVRKDDLERKIERIFDKLESIDIKLDRKVDRDDCPVIHAAQLPQSRGG
jgi:hypothetical protein